MAWCTAYARLNLSYTDLDPSLQIFLHFSDLHTASNKTQNLIWKQCECNQKT